MYKKNLNNFLGNFKLIEPKIVREIQVNQYNEVYQLRDSTLRQYVLRIGKKKFPEETKFEVEILKQLFIAGLPVPEIIPTKKDEDFFVDVNGFVFTIFTWINGNSFSIKNNISDENLNGKIFQAGQLLAKLHDVSWQNFNFVTNKRSIYTELERVIENEEKFKKIYENGNEFVVNCKKSLEFAKSFKNSLKLIHNDFRPQNLLYSNEGVINGLIDFDWSCFGPAIKDVSHSIIEWSFPDGYEDYSMDKIDSFLDGYNSISSTKYTKNFELKSWMYFSAISDAATYFIDQIENSKEFTTLLPLKSYMYKKANKSQNLW